MKLASGSAAAFCILVFVILAAGWLYTLWQTGVIERRFPPRGAFVEIRGGVHLHYTDRQPVGVARGAVVLLHGASGNQADLMVPLGDRLAALGFRVLAFDRPGHGWSDRPDGEDEDASPARQAALIGEGLRRLGVSDAIVVGHSWSGALAAVFALDHRDVTGGAVLLSPVIYPWPTGIDWYYGPAASRWLGPAFTRILTLPAGQALLPAGIASVFAPQAPPPDFAERTGLELVLRPEEFENNAADVFHLHAFVTILGPRLPGIAVPVAIVAGDSDRIAPAFFHAERLARELPGATLALLPGRGHSPHWSDPAVVAAAVVSVADRMAQPAAGPPGAAPVARDGAVPSR